MTTEKTVQGAKLCLGVWLPETETHFVEMMTTNKKNHRIVDGFGTYQYRKLEAAMKAVPSDRRRRCIDIGGHVGLWSMWLTKEFRQVEIFEPVPLHASILPHNMESVGRSNYELHRIALGSEAGAVNFALPLDNTGHAHVRAKTPHDEQWGKSGEVEMRTLDSFGFTDVDFIKIDVEGFELQVVKGAEQTLRSNKPYMVLEQKGNDAGVYGQPRNAALEWCRGIGMVSRFEMGGDWFLAWS